MLEALVAAPFVRLGVPLRWAMPAVSSCLALLPYWSFALWNHKHGRVWAALAFALTPLLLPVEFGMITTIPRGFVTGLAPLAFLPWIYGLTHTWIRSLLTGSIIAVAWAINPNSLIFSCAYGIWFVLSRPEVIKSVAAICLGALPPFYLHVLAKSWCNDHSDAIIHRLSVDIWHFDPQATWNSLCHLGDHFQWLCPVAWSNPEMIGIGLIALCMIAYLKNQWPLAIALTLTVLAIIASFSMPKVQDGWDSVFYPLSRMFLALPLLLAWAASMLFRKVRISGNIIFVSFLIASSVVCYKISNIRATAEGQFAAPTKWFSVQPYDVLIKDAIALNTLCIERNVDLIVVPKELGTGIWAQFRAYMYPTMIDELPPTYLFGYERRYWQRELYGNAVVPNILVIGGPLEKWGSLGEKQGQLEAVRKMNGDAAYLIVGNTQPTDALLNDVIIQLNSP